MNDIITSIKAAIIGTLSSLFAFFAPIENNFVALVWLFALNFFVGLLADVIAGRDFSLKKAISCLSHAAMFFVLCASLYGIGYYQKMSADVLHQCVSSFCWILIYCYSTNIVRNVRSTIKESSPAYRAADLLYKALTLAFVKTLPFVEEILKQRREERNESK